jgi:general secretion pathway protein L
MAQVYALLEPDGSLLVARPRGNDWIVSNSLSGADKNGRNVTVFLSGFDVLGLEAIIPAKNETQARRAAPFAIEDEIGDAIENSHVALAPPNKQDPSEPRRLNVASSDALRDIVVELSVRGLSEAEIVAAHSVLPQQDILFEGPGLLLGRLGQRSFTLDASIGRDVVVSLLDGYSDVMVCGDHLSQALNRPSQGPAAESREALLKQLIAWARSSDVGINLRQGQFAPSRSIEFTGLKQWRMVGAIAATAAIGWFGILAVETHGMKQRSAGLDQLAEEFARVGWPETNGDVQQVLALSASERGSSGQAFPSLLDASAILYDALSQVEGSELRTIRYDRLRGQMTASVAFESFADVDRLTSIVNTTGLRARSGDSRQSGSKVIGDLTVESPA